MPIYWFLSQNIFKLLSVILKFQASAHAAYFLSLFIHLSYQLVSNL